MNPPRIGVVVPLYNKARYVEEAVRSALEQVPPVAEVIVVDDGSSDDGAERVKRIADGRVRLLRQANAGVSAARNRGILECGSDFVAFLDADDRYRTGFIAAIVDMIYRFQEADLFASAYVRESTEGVTLGAPLIASDECNARPYLLNDFYGQWAQEPMFCASSLCIRRDAMVTVPVLFPEGEKLGEDQDVWFRLAERSPIAYCPRPLAVYRVGVAGGATRGNHRPTAILPCYERLGTRLRNATVPDEMRRGARKLLASHVLNVARALADGGRKSEALRLILDSRAAGNPAYWIRSAGAVLVARRTSLESH